MAEEEVSQEAPKPKRKWLKWVIILVLLLGLGAGGWYAYQRFFAAQEPGAEETAETAAPEAAAPGEPGVNVSLDPFVVNLSDPLGRRYLKLSMEVELSSPDAADELSNRRAMVRDAVIMLLSSKSYQELSSMESKIELKREIVERLNQILGGPKVMHVYITDLVVQ